MAATIGDVTVSYHDRVSKLQAFDHLARSPFDRSDWYGLLAQFGKRPLVAMAEGPGGAAALPLVRTESGFASLHHWFAFAWRPLATPGPAGDALLRAMAKDLRNQAPCITLDYLPDEDGSATRLRAAFRSAGWLTRLEPRDTNHVLNVGTRNFATYWAQRPGPMRTTLKRKAKKVDVEISTGFDNAAWQAYVDIYNRSWKTVEQDAGLLEAFARREGDLGHLRLGVARHEGVPVAAQFWTVEHGTAFIHKLAYDQDHAKLSAGTTLSAALFAHVIDTDKVALVDFGTGGDGYKRDWMDTERPRYRLTCVDPLQPAAWRLVARKAADRLASHLRRG
ncbi:MAG: GNAT family N-acetyltransferase [Alphaproteobacteria bacterium]|nr:GNAT family N-acetyltransferase [Alphaproteobacteria bacterium]